MLLSAVIGCPKATCSRYSVTRNSDRHLYSLPFSSSCRTLAHYFHRSSRWFRPQLCSVVFPIAWKTSPGTNKLGHRAFTFNDRHPRKQKKLTITEFPLLPLGENNISRQAFEKETTESPIVGEFVPKRWDADRVRNRDTSNRPIEGNVETSLAKNEARVSSSAMTLDAANELSRTDTILVPTCAPNSPYRRSPRSSPPSHSVSPPHLSNHHPLRPASL